MRILILNCGSSSIKFQTIDLDRADDLPAPAERWPRGSVERIGGPATLTFIDANGRTQSDALTSAGHAPALDAILTHLGLRPGQNPLRLDAVGHRVVHGGDRFTAPTRIDAPTLAALDALNDLAPLHNPACIAGIKAARSACGADLPMAAVFDTAFHHTLPDYAATYAIPHEWTRRHRIRRYGFHGIAHQYVAMRYGQISETPTDRAKLITLHLGNGCSATAICRGQSIDTSMGFTPLEGLVMGTRCGDLDPAIIGYVGQREGVSSTTVEEWLNHRSGLLGVSQTSADMRELIAAMPTDDNARLAVEVFCYRASKYVGAYLSALGGADAIIFSGGIGEHSPEIRARICERLRWCGLTLDGQRNAATVGVEGCISGSGSMQAYVIPADEELLIARETLRCIKDATTP